MGLFDKIKDNAKNISMRTLYEDVPDQPSAKTPAADNATVTANPISEPEIIDFEDRPIEASEALPVSVEPDSELIIVSTPDKNIPNEPLRESKNVSPDVPIAATVKEPVKIQEPEKPQQSVTIRSDVPKQEKPKPAAPVKAKITVGSEKTAVKTIEKPAQKHPVSAKQVIDRPVIDRPSDDKPAPERPTPVDVQTPSVERVDFTPMNAVGKPKVIDVAPQRSALDNTRKSLYARERAALVALAARRRMDGTVPIYATNHQTFRTRIFIDRIEYSGTFGKNVLPIEQVAWIKLRAGGTGVIIETTEGKRAVMVVKPKDRLSFADAVMKVQSMQPKRVKFRDTYTVRIDQLDKIGEGVDEIEKLSRLYDKGIISQEEFELKKKQILGI